MDGLVSAYNSRELDIGTVSSPGISELAALVNPRPIASHPQRKALCGRICLKFTHSSFLLTPLYLPGMFGEVQKGQGLEVQVPAL